MGRAAPRGIAELAGVLFRLGATASGGPAVAALCFAGPDEIAILPGGAILGLARGVFR